MINTSLRKEAIYLLTLQVYTSL